MSSTVFMGQTQISVQRTVAEILRLLGACGAEQIHQQLQDGEPCGMAFSVRVDGLLVSYVLPVRPEPIFRMLQDNRRRQPGVHVEEDRELAGRIAWRQVFRWLQAQLALIEHGMAESAEIFMPYQVVGRGNVTLFEAVRNGQLALPGPEER